MNKLSLVSVHHWEAEGSALLFRLLGQLDQVHQLTVNHGAERGVSLHPVFHEVRVARNNFTCYFSIVKVESISEPGISSNLETFLVALQLSVLLGQLCQVDGVARLQFRHL